MQIIDKWCYVRDSDNTLYVINVPSKALRKDKYGVWSVVSNNYNHCHWIRISELEDELSINSKEIDNSDHLKVVLGMINSISLPTNEDLIELTLRMEVLNCNYEYIDYEDSSNK